MCLLEHFLICREIYLAILGKFRSSIQVIRLSSISNESTSLTHFLSRTLEAISRHLTDDTIDLEVDQRLNAELFEFMFEFNVRTTFLTVVNL
jgi:hypothetical protein